MLMVVLVYLNPGSPSLVATGWLPPPDCLASSQAELVLPMRYTLTPERCNLSLPSLVATPVRSIVVAHSLV